MKTLLPISLSLLISIGYLAATPYSNISNDNSFQKRSSQSATAEKTSLLITASQYCEFLNQMAATDPWHLYETAMGNNMTMATIIRSGEPGSYFYSVVSGHENYPISYIKELAAMRFCN